MPQSFSDQLRQAVRDCGTSRYALAKQLDIAESTLSRFLSGERGMTLDVLNRMADVLGLQIVVTVQKAHRPSKPGPKPKGEKKMVAKTKQSKADWERLAWYAAKDAQEKNFSSRRGIYFFKDVGVLCVYNNNPYGDEPLSKQTRRENETAAFRRWLNKEGIKELAYATYPDIGEQAGYSYAMLLDAGYDREAEVKEVMQAILMESWNRFECVANKKGG